MTPDQALAAAILAIYAILSLPVLYVAFRHGFSGLAILGWGYLFIFCTLKMVGSGMQLHDSQSLGASIVSNVGLSPILLAAAGVLHEARFYRASPQARHCGKNVDAVGILLYHIHIMAAIALVAVGVSKATHAKTGDEVNHDLGVAKAGAAILCVGWLALVLLSIISALPGIMDASHQSQHNHGTRLLIAVLLALPFLGIRVFVSLAYFVSGNQAINGAIGEMGHRVGLYIVQELVVTLLLLSVGIMTRNIGREDTNEHSSGHSSPNYLK